MLLEEFLMLGDKQANLYYSVSFPPSLFISDSLYHNRGGGSSWTLVRQNSQRNTNFHSQVVIYTCFVKIGQAVSWSAWPAPPPLSQV